MTRLAVFDLDHTLLDGDSDVLWCEFLMDRGLLAPGHKADINIIDFDRLALEKPYIVHDLPAGGKRLLQKARGYCATIVSGKVTYREGVATGEMPGRLVRGPQPEPQPA